MVNTQNTSAVQNCARLQAIEMPYVSQPWSYKDYQGLAHLSGRRKYCTGGAEIQLSGFEIRIFGKYVDQRLCCGSSGARFDAKTAEEIIKASPSAYL